MTTNTPTERLEELAEAYRAWKNEEVDSGIYVLEAVGPALEAYATLLAELAQARAEVGRLEGVIEKMRDVGRATYGMFTQADLDRLDPPETRGKHDP